VDALLSRGAQCVTVLDVSSRALERTRRRLGRAGAAVTWIAADVTGEWTVPIVDIWHDRAAFHFLTEAQDRAAYMAHLQRAVRPGGAVVLATFGLRGPDKCSGLAVARYDTAGLASQLGHGFTLIASRAVEHHTPSGAVQPFCYAAFRRVR
jgi:ubiquinone/menaquinone biosynthesis C-methylase UbiE